MPKSAKEQFLETFDREAAKTIRVLRAYPPDKADLKPGEKLRTARELAWVFNLERGLGRAVWNDELAKGVRPGAKPAAPPEKWDDLLTGFEKANAEYRAMIASASDGDLQQKVHFFVGPKTMGEYTRLEWIWFLLHDEIHHRGQFSIYLRLAGAKVPSIYGPSEDEPWV